MVDSCYPATVYVLSINLDMVKSYNETKTNGASGPNKFILITFAPQLGKCN
jgi:hypothetical protein